MGGNALKDLGVVRLNATLYKLLTDHIKARVMYVLGVEPVRIESYKSKESFGDADFLIPSQYLYEGWVEKLATEFKSRGWVKNGDVVSMEVSDFQVDFIKTPPEKMVFAQTYFAFNDLGNLMGRIAHKMGFKYGHDGLTYMLRDDDHVIAEIDVDVRPREIFEFLDLPFNRWESGFETLEDIFKFVASSVYFNPDIYLLDNRNHVSRVRDAKRDTYMKFLEWCASQTFNYKFDWASNEKEFWHARFLEKAFIKWPTFKKKYDEAVAAHQQRKAEAEVFNGRLVMEWEPRAKNEMVGQILKYVKSKDGFSGAIETKNQELLKSFVKEAWKIYGAPL